MAMSANEFLKQIENGTLPSLCGTKCCDCGVRLDYDITGLQRTTDGYMCDDCYFSRLGDIVERDPICNPVYYMDFNRVASGSGLGSK